jgi:hypothetical protein
LARVSVVALVGSGAGAASASVVRVGVGFRQMEPLLGFALNQAAFGAGCVNFRFRDYTFQVESVVERIAGTATQQQSGAAA